MAKITQVVAYGKPFKVSEMKRIATLKRENKTFFENGKGDNEVYTVYRGCLIVEKDKAFPTNEEKRQTIVYLFGQDVETGEQRTHCLGSVKEVIQGRTRIDEVLDAGRLDHK